MAIYQKHGINAEIDDEMLPVIQALNDLDLRTVSCCCGHGGRKKAQLSFRVDDVDVLFSRGIISLNWKRILKK